MANTDQSPDAIERREFFRIRDAVALEFKVVANTDVISDPPQYPFATGLAFHLIHEFTHIDQDCAAALRQIAEESRALATYLAGVERKLSLLARTLAAQSGETESSPTHEVTLSEGGLSFEHSTPFPVGTLLALKLTLFPSYVGILLFGKVVQCTTNGAGHHGVGVEFVRIRDQERQFIARYVMRRQAEWRRAQLDRDSDTT